MRGEWARTKSSFDSYENSRIPAGELLLAQGYQSVTIQSGMILQKRAVDGCSVFHTLPNLVTWKKSKITSHRTQAIGGCLGQVSGKTVGTCSESLSAAILRVLGSIFYFLSIFYLSSIYLLISISDFYLHLSIAFISLLSFPASFGSAKYSRKTSSGAVRHWYMELPVQSSTQTTVLQAAPSLEEEVLAWTSDKKGSINEQPFFIS